MENNPEEITFITGNSSKAKHLKDYLHFPVNHLDLDLPEIQSLDLRAVVEDKAKRAYGVVKKPVLVEDVSLVFNALDKLPGPLVKWFFGTLGNKKLCDLLNQYEDRNAVAEVQFALCDKGKVVTFKGSMKGTIARSPRGGNGFGWDPIFIPSGSEKTWAEMSSAEKNVNSMRRIALIKAKQYFMKKYNG